MIEQEIQGRKHGFMHGNLAYYIGGHSNCWKVDGNETIGLTHLSSMISEVEVRALLSFMDHHMMSVQEMTFMDGSFTRIQELPTAQ